MFNNIPALMVDVEKGYIEIVRLFLTTNSVDFNIGYIWSKCQRNLKIKNLHVILCSLFHDI